MFRYWLILISVLITLAVLPFSAYAEGGPAGRSQYHRPSKGLKMTTGVISLSSLVHRGATTYSLPVIYPYSRLQLWEGRIEANAKGVGVGFEIDPQWTAKVGLTFFSSDVFLPLFGEQKPWRKGRDFSLEPYAEVTYSPVRWMTFVGAYYQDVTTHQSPHLESTLKLKLPAVTSQRRPILIPILFSSVGAAAADHNRYLYGPEGEGGFNYTKVGMTLVFPRLFPKVSPLATLYTTNLIGAGNLAGTHVRDKTSSVVGMLAVPYEL